MHPRDPRQGRAPTAALRRDPPITCEVGVLPRVHGSAVFTRGETQALCTVTLGTSSDEQLVDGAEREYSQKFMLHYNFPPLLRRRSAPIRGPGRREIGHGALAERALIAVLPAVDVPLHRPRHQRHPRVQRLLLDGQRLRRHARPDGRRACRSQSPVAGISIGLVQEGDKHGPAHRHHRRGRSLRRHGLQGRRHARRHHRHPARHQDRRASTDDDHPRRRCTRRAGGPAAHPRRRWPRRSPRRGRRSASAPRGCCTIKINPEKIGKLIGPGGKNIKADPGARPAPRSTSRTTARSTSRRSDGRRPRRPRHHRGDDRRGEGRQDLQRPGRQHQGLRRVRRDRSRNRRPVPRLGAGRRLRRPRARRGGRSATTSRSR